MFSKPINVLNCLHRSDFGGAHRRIVWVNELLKKKDINTTVLFPADNYFEFEEFLNKNQVQFVRTFLPAIRKSISHILLFIITLPISVVSIVRIIQRNKIQIVHVNGATNLQPVLAALLMARGVVWHWNDTLTPKWFVRLISKILKLHTISFVAATPYILKYYDINNIPCVVIPAPYPNSAQKQDPMDTTLRNLLELKQNEKIIGFVSHILAAKGAMEFVRASIIVFKQVPDLHAVLVGGAFPRHKSFIDSIHSEIEQNSLQDRIHLLGYQDNVLDLMKEFDLFVFPSRSEACPIVVLQAMQAGKPIVATRVGDVPYMLADTGAFIVEPMDIEGIARSIQNLLTLSDEEKLAMTKKMRNNLYKNYTLAQVSSLHFKVYNQTVKQCCN